jgi:hypothetical protein
MYENCHQREVCTLLFRSFCVCNLSYVSVIYQHFSFREMSGVLNRSRTIFTAQRSPHIEQVSPFGSRSWILRATSGNNEVLNCFSQSNSCRAFPHHEFTIFCICSAGITNLQYVQPGLMPVCLSTISCTRGSARCSLGDTMQRKLAPCLHAIAPPIAPTT